MFSTKLKPGDEIRIVSPSRSLAIVSEATRKIAMEKLVKNDFKITFAPNVEELDEFASSSIQSRVADLHEAFADKQVKAILTTLGGFNVNQILKYLDYNLIKQNPKIICGFSDITALSNAIYAKTDLVTYIGPHFSTFGMVKGLEYTEEYFAKCLMTENEFSIEPSSEWSDDKWFLDQEKRKFIANKGYWKINFGQAQGKIIGGNLCTLNLLQGTEFMPSLADSILFVEDDYETYPADFDRNLQSLIHLPDFSGVQGFIIGRFQKKSKINKKTLTKIIKTKKELDNLPIIANVDFGHTTPMITFPIGGQASLAVNKKDYEIKIIKH